MKCLLTILLSFFIFIMSASMMAQNKDGFPKKYKKYDKLIKKVNQYENDNNYKAARDLIIYNKKFYLEDSFELLKELIYINEKLSRYDDNLGLFIKGNQLGYFFLLHPALPKYKPYLQMDGFNELARSDTELRAKAIEKSTTLYELETPKKYKSNNYYPVIFIFHGGGSNLQKVMNHWSSRVLNKNFIKVFLQSYRYYDSGTFGWKSGDERTDSDILNIYKEVSKSYRIDSTRIYVAGISAGATYAIDMAFRKVIPVSGIIAFCPGLPQDIVAESLEEDKLRHMKAYIVSGENDYYQGKQRQMTEIFDSIGFQYKQVIIDEMGHQYPKNENFYIDQGIKYIEN